MVSLCAHATLYRNGDEIMDVRYNFRWSNNLRIIASGLAVALKAKTVPRQRLDGQARVSFVPV